MSKGVGRNRRLALLVAGCVVLGAIGAMAVVVVTHRSGSQHRVVRPSAGLTTRRAAPLVSAPLPRAVITTMTPISGNVSEPVVGGGAIWVVGPDGARRIDPASGAVVASLPPGHGPRLFADGAFWSLTADRDRRCDPPSFSGPSYSPYRVEKLDPATNAIAFGIDLPGTCRYEADNRDPEAELVVGTGTAWVLDPLTCRLFTIDTSRGTVATVPRLVGPLVTADASGAWFVSRLGTNVASSPSCAQRAPPLGLARLDPAGTVGRASPLPGSQGITGISIADGVAWVTYALDPLAPRGAHAFALARLDTNTGAVLTTRISPGSVATGDGHVWFLGSFPGNRRQPKDTNPGLLGEIDPQTGTVKRAFQLDLISTASQPAKIVAVSGDAVWIDTQHAPREVIQVAT